MTNNENGRSMVEMLGVLAIIGIITLGGLAGYRTAMQKFRANSIAELISTASIVGQTQNRCIDKTDLEEDFETLPQCVTAVEGAGNGQVKITFKTDDDNCDAIRQALKTSFTECSLYEEGDDLFYIPSRSKEEGNCEDYNKDSCFN